MIVITEELCARGRFLQELSPATVANAGWVGFGAERGPAALDRRHLQAEHESMGIPKNAKLPHRHHKEMDMKPKPDPKEVEMRGKAIIGLLIIGTILLVDIVLLGLAKWVWTL